MTTEMKKTFEARKAAVAAAIYQTSKNAVKNEILKTAELLMCSTATDEQIAEHKEMLGMSDPECGYGLIWVNAGYYDHLECIPMLTTKGDTLVIWYDGEDGFPDVRTEDEVCYSDLVSLLDLLQRKLKETDERDRAFWKRIRDIIGEEGLARLRELAKGI